MWVDEYCVFAFPTVKKDLLEAEGIRDSVSFGILVLWCVLLIIAMFVHEVSSEQVSAWQFNASELGTDAALLATGPTWKRFARLLKLSR